MQHLNEEQLVEHYYHDDAQPSVAEEHLRTCSECRAQYETIRRVLALVTDAPIPERNGTYGEEIWNRLRWKIGRDATRGRRVAWKSMVAAAAVLAIAFFAGQLWHARQTAIAPTTSIVQTVTPSPTTASRDRVLFVVVSDHLEDSERMLQQLANADPSKGLDDSVQQERATELLASNRMYRQTAAKRGDARIASVLADIEPILVELSNAGTTLDADHLAEIQKRIEAKGLLFKVRVLSAQTGSGDRPPTETRGTDL
ncbi:MAG TPA: hypothetical protein VMU84_15460 [Thermoanaerobaculia bacterium]|nr:hypothetical protein [Thermoanaerobaculia bacterium]